MTTGSTGAADAAPRLAEPVVVGEGVLSWPRGERVSDRYGLVNLFAVQPDYENPHDATPPAEIDYSAVAGRRGRLVAEVVAPGRRSAHIGDLFRGLRPPATPPRVGHREVLGHGVVFTERDDGVTSIGLRPEGAHRPWLPADQQDSSSDWLNPRALYTMHDQRVRLTFEEEIDGA